MVYTAIPIALTNLQLKKLHLAQKTNKGITLKLSNNTNLPNTQIVELKLTDTQIKKLNKAGDKMIYINFSVTQLKHKGAGIWGALMKMGRCIGKACSKFGSSGIGKVIKTAAAPLVSGLIETGVSYSLSKDLKKRDEEEAQQQQAQQQAQQQQQSQQQGNGLYRAALWGDELHRAGLRGNGLYRAGLRGNGLYRAGLRGNGLYRVRQQGYGLNDIATLLNVMPKLLLKQYKNITNNELQTLFSILLDLEHKNLLPEALPEKITNDIKKQEGGFLPFLAPILACIVGPLIGSLLVGQSGSGIKKL